MAATGLVTWDNLHKKKDLLELFSYTHKTSLELTPLLDGLSYHNSLDYTSHTEYKNSKPGYSYASITPQLLELMKKTINVPDARVRTSCHNLIEAGVDYHLLNDNNDMATLIRTSIEQVDKHKLAGLLSGYYQKTEEKALWALNDFFTFATNYNLKDIDGWVKLLTDMNKYYLKIETNELYAKKTLETAFEITKDTWKEYLEFSISHPLKEITDCN